MKRLFKKPNLLKNPVCPYSGKHMQRAENMEKPPTVCPEQGEALPMWY